MPRIKEDSIYLDIDGKEDVRLDLFPRDQPLDLDLITVGMYHADEGGEGDLEHVHYRVSKLQADGSWKEMHGNDFTYPFQRAAQPQMDELGKLASGPWFCETTREYKYTHIPLHHPRELNKDLFKK